MSSRHTILARITHETDDESVDLEIDITFNYTPGCAEQGPSYESGGEPAEAAEVEFVSAELVEPEGAATPDEVNELAFQWLASDRGYEEACELAGEYHDYD